MGEGSRKAGDGGPGMEEGGHRNVGEGVPKSRRWGTKSRMAISSADNRLWQIKYDRSFILVAAMGRMLRW